MGDQDGRAASVEVSAKPTRGATTLACISCSRRASFSLRRRSASSSGGGCPIPGRPGPHGLWVGGPSRRHDHIDIRPLAVVVCENHVQLGMFDGVGAVDPDHPIPPRDQLLNESSLPREDRHKVSQPIPDAVMAVIHPASDIADQPVEPPAVQHARALPLGPDIPVSTLLCCPRRRPPQVPRVGHTEAEPRGNRKVVIRHEVGRL